MNISDMHRKIAENEIKVYLAAAEKSAPYIGENGNWFVFSSAVGRFVDTGILAEGKKGEQGKDGVSPTATVAQTENGAEISITDVNGTTTATVSNGKDGKDGTDGVDGNDGYTPQRGIDYWTEEDKAEIKGYVDDKTGDIETALDDIEAIAKGRATGYVFDTVDDMNTWLADSDNVANLVLGDNLYIRATDVPDYWWDGTQAQQLETQKVDLAEYVKNTDYATLETAGVVKVRNYTRGLYMDNGILTVYGAEYSDIEAKISWSRPITPVNLEYAVQVCTNQDSSAELAEAQLKLPPSTQFVKDYIDETFLGGAW